MSLYDEIVEHYKESSYLPDFNIVHNEVLEERRWGDLRRWVFNRDDEYVAVEDVEPATEYQDWGDYGKPTVYRVTPVEKIITVTEYEKI